MNIAILVCLWNKNIQSKVRKIINECDFPLFIRLLADKRQFWYACVWMSTFTNDYFQKFPNQDLEQFFKKADKSIASMPDLFKDKLYMQAHGLLWKFGFKKFFNNIHYAIEIIKLLQPQFKNDDIN